MKSALLPTNKWPSRVDVTETDVVFAVPGGLPHAVKEDALQLGPYRVSRGHFLLGDFQGIYLGPQPPSAMIAHAELEVEGMGLS